MTVILPAEIRDAEILREVCIKAFEEDKSMYGLMPPDIDKISWHKCNIDRGLYYKIVVNNEIVGGVKLFSINTRHYRVGTIYITPEHQNNNIGTEVINFIEGEYPQVKKWSLDTPYKSFRNHHFYEKLGYIKIGEEHPNQGSEFCLYLYEKNITRE